MPITTEQVRGRIAQALAGADVSVTDTTGGGDHFSARVVWSGFQGLGTLERHRAVYGALGDLMRGPIHALSLVAQTPDETVQGQEGRGRTP